MSALPVGDREAARPNHVRGLFLGTLTGSGLVAGVVAATTIAMGLSQEARGDMLGGVVASAALFFLFSLPVWAMGLILVGAPGWAILHALGWRTRGVGAAFGGIATFGATWLLNRWLNFYPHGSPPLLILAGVLALIGAVVGWVVVFTGYDKEGRVP
jgi:hypothetical protein